MKFSKNKTFAFLGIFFLILYYFSFLSIKNLKVYERTKLKQEKIKYKTMSLKDKETTFKMNFQNRDYLQSCYGSILNLFGNKMYFVDKNTPIVYKGKNHMLYESTNADIDFTSYAKNVSTLRDEIALKKGNFTFVIAPNKHSISSPNFPKGVSDSTTKITNNLSNSLTESGVNVLDLNLFFYKDQLKEEQQFLSTDSRWSYQCAFWGYNNIIDYFLNEYSMQIADNVKTGTKDNFTVKTIDKKYYGDFATMTNKTFAGNPNELSLLIPDFETDFSMKKYDKNKKLKENKKGDFEKVFISNKDLEDKYLSFIGTREPFVEIKNNNINNSSTLYVIGDDNAYSLLAYLALNFENVKYFDITNTRAVNTFIKDLNSNNPMQVVYITNSKDFVKNKAQISKIAKSIKEEKDKKEKSSAKKSDK